VLSGEPYARTLADLWSCGVLLHFMLTESLPVLEPACSGGAAAPRLRLDGLSPACRDLLVGMLQTDPDKRMDMWIITNHPWFQEECPEVTP
jgi:serine/threonine protein kinase